MRRSGFVAALGGAMMLGGCATVVRGTDEPVQFDSEPSGAEMRSVVDYPCGGPCIERHDRQGTTTYIDEGTQTPTVPGPACVTPCTVQVPRNQSLIVTFTKPGYEPETVKLGTKVAGGGVAATAGNVIVGGAVGLVTDAVTGAGMDHYPNPLKVVLKPVAAPASLRSTPKRGR